MPRMLLSGLVAGAFLLGGCEVGRAFGGGDLVESSVTYFSPPEAARFPFETPFMPITLSPVESAGPGMLRFNGRTFRHVSTRSDRVLARGVYRAPLPLHVYQEVLEGPPRGCPDDDPTCKSWLALFEANVITDGQYSSLSPRRVSIDRDWGHCIQMLFVTGDEAEAREAIVRAGNSTGVTGVISACEREPVSGAYDPATHIFTPGAR